MKHLLMTILFIYSQSIICMNSYHIISQLNATILKTIRLHCTNSTKSFKHISPSINHCIQQSKIALIFITQNQILKREQEANEIDLTYIEEIKENNFQHEEHEYMKQLITFKKIKY